MRIVQLILPRRVCRLSPGIVAKPAGCLLAAVLLAGCATKPIQPPKVIEVVVEKIVPVPEKLTEPCQSVEAKGRTVGEAVRLANARRLALEECSARLAKIRGLTK